MDNSLNYMSLLRNLETKLLSLNKKGLKYINIEPLPEFELKNLIDGLEEITSIENRISLETRKTENKTIEKPEKCQRNEKDISEIINLKDACNKNLKKNLSAEPVHNTH